MYVCVFVRVREARSGSMQGVFAVHAGLYQNASGQLACVDCGVGQHQALSSATTCDACLWGTFSTGTPRSSCTACTPGTWASKERLLMMSCACVCVCVCVRACVRACGRARLRRVLQRRERQLGGLRGLPGWVVRGLGGPDGVPGLSGGSVPGESVAEPVPAV